MSEENNMPKVDDRIYALGKGWGIILEIEEYCGEQVYIIAMDDGRKIEMSIADFEVED